MRNIRKFIIFLVLIFLFSFTVSAWEIKDVSFTSSGANSVFVSFVTDEPTTAIVNYGTDEDSLTLSVEDSLAPSHSVLLSGLSPATEYFFEIVAEDSSGVSDRQNRDADAHVLKFKTEGVGDSDAPSFVTEPSFTLGTGSTASVSWECDEPCNGVVSYDCSGTTGSAEELSYRTSQSVSFSVEDDASCSYSVEVCDEAGNCITSNEANFVSDNSRPSLDFNLPDAYGKSSIMIEGTTKPFSDVVLMGNGIWAGQKTSDSSGHFKFPSVSLTSYGDSVTFIITVTDSLGNEVQGNHIMRLNFVPPNLIVDVPNNASGSLTVEGSVDQLCAITFEIYDREDAVPPGVVENLIAGDVGTNSISISWDELDDAIRYLIYRDGVRITSTASRSFVDIGPSVGSGMTYSYQISALDENCNEGEKSDSLEVETLAGGEAQTFSPSDVEIGCNGYSYSKTINIQGDFSQTIPLTEGRNYLKITAVNEFGNEDSFEGEILMDTEKPVISDTNMNMLTPSYSSHVKIRGTVSEPSTIYAYLNGENSPSYSTNANGSFSLEVALSRDSNLVYDETGDTSGTSGIALSTQWMNTVKLVAVDEFGHESDPLEGNILYTMCGAGSWFSVKVHDQTPDMLSPRMILEGFAQVGLSVDIEWQGGDMYTPRIRDITVHERSIPLEDKDEWDTDWFAPSFLSNKNNTNAYGYITLKIPPKDPSNGENWTVWEKEKNISEHREGECVDGLFGCLRYPLVIDIEFEQDEFNGTLHQKTCVDVESTIEDRIPPDYLPENFLQTMVDTLDGTINLIDDVLEPLKTLNEYAMYSCMAMMGVNFIMDFSESYSCGFSPLVAKLMGKKIELGKAQMGVCNDGQNGQVMDDKDEACVKCMEKIDSRKKLEAKMAWVCDRVFCPSAPTFQKFFDDSHDKLGSELKDVPTGNTYDSDKTIEKLAEKGMDKFDDDDYSYDCALVPKNELQDYMKKNAAKTQKVDFPEECKGLHVPNPVCCKYDYLAKWDTACLIMDEFKESACLQAQLSSDPSVIHTPKGDVKCNVLWNSAAGFCDPKGGVKPDLIGTKYTPNMKSVTKLAKFANDPNLYFRVFVDKNKKYLVEPGYISTDVELVKSEEIIKGEAHTVNSKTVFYPLSSSGDINIGEIFEKEKESDIDTNKEVPQEFVDEIKKYACEGKSYVETKTENKDGSVTINKNDTCKVPTINVADKEAIDLYNEIKSKLGISDRTEIVDPSSTLLRSMQCACLPAVKGYLSLYHNMMVAVKNCFETILLTGDGSAGMCRATISVYACDLLYDVIRCFMEKYSISGTKATKGFSIGNFFGTMTQASNKITEKIQGRYGGSRMFNAMFGERKLAHSLCMFAFTGTWDLDVAGMVENDFSMPVKSTGMVYPCERRFVGYDQTRSGISTWNYHIGAGMVAGADLSYKLKLICSSGYKCDPQEGFENGRCDCSVSGQKETVVMDGQLKAGEVLDGDLGEQFWNRQDTVRYDKAILEWTYEDKDNNVVTKNAECSMNQVGGEPPAFCSLETSTGEYRCDFNFGQDGWAMFTENPRPVYYNSGSGDFFSLGEKMKFEVPVTSKIPQDSECNSYHCSYSKYVDVVVKKDGKEIARSSPKMISWQEPHVMELIVNEALTSNMFKAGVASSSATRFGGTRGPLSVSGFPVGVNSKKWIYMGHYKGENNVFYYVSDNALSSNNNFQDLSRTQCEDGILDPTNNKIKFVCKGVSITFSAPLTKDSETLVYVMEYDPGSSDYCESASEVVLDAYFTIHDAKETGGSWGVDLNTIHKAQDVLQEKKIQIKAKCDERSTSSIPICPDPMYNEWVSYTQLGGGGSCSCSSNTCLMNSDKPFCVSGICQKTPAEIKDCPNVMKDWNEVGGADAMCNCGGVAISRISEDYCVSGLKRSDPACNDGQETNVRCYCGDGNYCNAGEHCNGDGICS